MRFFLMSQGSLSPKIRFLGQKVCLVARADRHSHTNGQTDSEYCQPIIKDRPNKDEHIKESYTKWLSQNLPNIFPHLEIFWEIHQQNTHSNTLSAWHTAAHTHYTHQYNTVINITHLESHRQKRICNTVLQENSGSFIASTIFQSLKKRSVYIYLKKSAQYAYLINWNCTHSRT